MAAGVGDHLVGQHGAVAVEEQDVHRSPSCAPIIGVASNQQVGDTVAVEIADAADRRSELITDTKRR